MNRRRVLSSGEMRLMPSEAHNVMFILEIAGEREMLWTAGDFSLWRIPAPVTLTYSITDSTRWAVWWVTTSWIRCSYKFCSNSPSANLQKNIQRCKYVLFYRQYRNLAKLILVYQIQLSNQQFCQWCSAWVEYKRCMRLNLMNVFMIIPRWMYYQT